MSADLDRGVQPPVARRPHMPGYGLLGPDEGSGLLRWDDVAARFAASHDYWVASRRPDGSPHVMPVWGVWDGRAFWFSSAVPSRKVRNLRAEPRCSVAADDAKDAVILDGVAAVVTEPAEIATFLAASNAKYSTDYGADFLDPARNAAVRVTPTSGFALLAADFTGSPTRFDFPAPVSGPPSG